MSINEIREDLKNIRYYYGRKKLFDEASADVGTNAVLEKIDTYNSAVRNAPPKLYDLYVSLYLNNQTQESLSDHLGYAVEYVSRLNSQLVRFFLKEFQKEENGDEK